MSKLAITVAVLMFLAAPAFPQTSTVVGTTVHKAPICRATELGTEAKALLSRWWELNQKMNAKTLTPEEFTEGQGLVLSGQCGLVPGGIPVVVQQLDGTDYFILLDGQTFVLKSSGFKRDTE